MDQKQNNRSILDGVAVFLSATCLLHCLALPVLITLYPIAHSSILDEQTFHLVMLLLILPASLIALTIGCRTHKDVPTMLLGAIGLTVLTVTALFGHDLVGIDGERILTSIGGLVLAAAHIQNFRICRADHCDHEGNHDGMHDGQPNPDQASNQKRQS